MIGTNHKARVEQLIAYYGENVTLSYTTSGAFDPVTGSYTGNTSNSVTVRAYLTKYMENEIDSSSILSSDIKAYFVVTDVVPTTGWTCHTVDKVYRVVDTRVIRKGGEVVHYVCQLRV